MVAILRLANIVLATGSALALTIFLRFVYQGWSGLRAYAGPLDAVLYYVCPLALAVLLLASLRLRHSQSSARAGRCQRHGISVRARTIVVEVFLTLMRPPGR